MAQKITTYKTIEWIDMPETLKDFIRDKFEFRFGHYTYLDWEIGATDYKEDIILDRYLTKLGFTDGQTVLILIDW